MFGGISATNASLTRAKTSPGERSTRLGTALSMPRVVAITSAAGMPLPVASPTTRPSRPSSSSRKS